MSPVHDVIAIGLPPQVTPGMLTTTFNQTYVREWLDRHAWRAVWDQWPKDRRPLRLEDNATAWTIVDDPRAVDLFEPGHDCDRCQEAQPKARAFLAEHPGSLVALGNLTYTEVWKGLL